MNPEATGAENKYGENIDKMATLRARHEQRIPPQEHAIASLISSVGRPRLLWAELVIVAVWVGGWCIAHVRGRESFDQPPFIWLQGLIGLSSLLLTTMVLIAQNRERHLNERRVQLDTQMNLLVEQKVAKIIELIEELRLDLPIRDRRDETAAAMKRATDPHELAAKLEEKLDPDGRHGDENVADSS
jgi:uncharacterized membrane protein